MSTLADRLVERCITLEVALLACRARLQAATDDEALHDLRIVVRRLRSLLRPLRGLPGVDTLEAASAEVGALSSPLRDLEVLVGELQRRGAEAAAAARRTRLQPGYRLLLADPALEHLGLCLAQWPGLLREAEREGMLRGWEGKVARRLRRQQQRLAEALADPAHDRHRLRLLVKRVRYAGEAWPQLQRLPAAPLKAAQAALGDWHDHLQWCLRAAEEADLRACLEHWEQAMVAAAQVADASLPALQALLQEAADA